tara:strand:- start:887 stop:1189 length:303 start_codon:yes stop_codon:yes gene_type:complete
MHGVKTVDGKVKTLVKIKDIDEIEVSYNCWMTFSIDGLENAELFRSGQVVRFWIKYCTLHMELKDGTIVEEHCYDEMQEDTKWPTQTMVCVDGEWSEYNE